MISGEKLNSLYKERLQLLKDMKTLNSMLSDTKIRLAQVTNKISLLESVDVYDD
jgi:hypothetical protein